MSEKFLFNLIENFKPININDPRQNEVPINDMSEFLWLYIDP